jgi:hypothetical protein
VNANIRRAAVSATAAGALVLVGGGTAMADEASYEQNSSAETASAGPNGAHVSSYEQSEEAEADVHPYYDSGGYYEDSYEDDSYEDDSYDDSYEEEDDGLLGLGIL